MFEKYYSNKNNYGFSNIINNHNNPKNINNKIQNNLIAKNPSDINSYAYNTIENQKV
jgi:hypothetical protein